MQSSYLCSMLELISVVFLTPASMSSTTCYAASVEDVVTIQL